MKTEIKKIGVLGAGIMGSGIAQSFLEKDFPVVLIDRDQDILDQANNQIFQSIQKRHEKQYLDHLPNRALLSLSVSLAAFHDCDLVIEVVPEDLTLKSKILQEIEAHISDHTILASNTSSIPISLLQKNIKSPGRFMGIHYMNPVVKIPLIELIPGETTSPDVVDKTYHFLLDLGKTPIRVMDTPGFVVNTLLIPMLNAAINMLAAGTASAVDIDKAMTVGANFPMGPLALADMIGLDTVLSIMRILENHDADTYKPASQLIEMVAAGKLGRKTGEGFFKY